MQNNTSGLARSKASLDARRRALQVRLLGFSRHVPVDKKSLVGTAPPWGLIGEDIQPWSPPARPYDCRDDCKICNRQYFPTARSLGDEEAKRLVENLVREITQDRAALQQALSHYREGIAARWLKWSREKRRTLLRSVSSLHDEKYGIRKLIPSRADVEAQRTQGTAAPYLDTWLAPWLDLETLAESPLPLLALLERRVSHHPSEWVMFDYQQHDLAHTYGVLGRYYNQHAITLTRDGFGRLVQWDKVRMHSHADFGFNAGLYILTTASRIFKILLGVIDGLVQEIRERAAKHGDNPSLPGPSQNVGQVSSTWASLVSNNFTSFGKGNPAVAQAQKPPFTNPEPMTLEELQGIIVTRDNAASDELDFVQSHADYVRHLVSEVQGSCPQQLLGEAGMWNFLAQTVLVQPLLNKLWWDEVRGRAERAAESAAAMSASVEAGDLSESANAQQLDVLLAFMHQACSQQLVTQLLQLYASLSHEPGIDSALLEDDEFDVELKTIDPLLWVLSTMGYDEGGDTSLPLSVSLDFFHSHLAAAKDEEKAKVSSRLLKRIADISTLNGIRMAIDCRRYNPCAIEDRSYANAVLIANEKTKIGRFLRVWEELDTDILSRKAAVFLRRLCTDSAVGDGTSESTVTSTRSALKDAWDAISRALRDMLKKSGLPDDLVQRHMRNLMPERRDALLERERGSLSASPSPSPASSPQASRAPTPENQPSGKSRDSPPSPPSLWHQLTFNRPQHATEQPTETIPGPATAAATTAPEDDAAGTPDDVAAAAARENKTVLPRDSYDLVLQMLGAAPTPQQAQAKHRWPKFVAAMQEAGFVPREGAGSAVTFRARDEQAGSITFHRPHPDATIFPIMLRTFGRRMAHWFGWRPDDFAPA